MEDLEYRSGLIAFLSMAEMAAVRVKADGKLSESPKGAPRRMAGKMGQPQFLVRGGPEEAGPRGMSPSRTFRPGKVGLEAKGCSEGERG